MTLTNPEQLNTSANLDTDLKENELSEDDLDAVSGGCPVNNSNIEWEQATGAGANDNYEISTTSVLNTRTYLDKKTVSL